MKSSLVHPSLSSLAGLAAALCFTACAAGGGDLDDADLDVDVDVDAAASALDGDGITATCTDHSLKYLLDFDAPAPSGGAYASAAPDCGNLVAMPNASVAWLDGSVPGQCKHGGCVSLVRPPGGAAPALDTNMTMNGADRPIGTIANYGYGASSLSYEAWVKVAPLSTSAKRTIFSADDGGWDWSLDYRETSATKFKFLLFYSTGEVLTAAEYDIGAFYHVAATFDAAAGGVAKLYVDGVEVLSHARSGGSTKYNLRMGQNPGYPGEYMQGTLDEVRIHTAALSCQEVYRDYHCSDLDLQDVCTAQTVTVPGCNGGSPFTFSCSPCGAGEECNSAGACVVPQCHADADCGSGTQCTVERCNDFVCEAEPLPDLTGCSPAKYAFGACCSGECRLASGPIGDDFCGTR